MKVIYKYEIIDLNTYITLPKNGYNLLTAKAIKNKIYIWVEIDTEIKLTENVNIVGLMTGEYYTGTLKYLATVFLNNGLVIHMHVKKGK